MRTCTTEGCSFTAPVEQFPLAGGRGNRSYKCLPCKRDYDNNHYHTRRDKTEKNRKQVERGSRNKVRLGEYLADRACIDCGNDNVIVLEFDHRDDEQKIGNVADMIHSYSWQRVLDEIAKCDVVCANCHRIRTWTRAGGSVRFPMPV